MEVWPALAPACVAPVANTVPSGRRIAGPTSPGGWYTKPPQHVITLISGGPCRFAIVLPPVTHLPTWGTYFSEFGLFFTSKVKTDPSESRVQPSSASKSLLPVEGTA